MSTKAEELQSKLQRRREAADQVCFESQPDKSAADVGRKSIDASPKEAGADGEDKGRRPEKKSTQDFKSAMNRQRGKTEEGDNFESNPEATRADVTATSGPGKSSPESGQQFESNPEATRADATAASGPGRSSPERRQAKKRGSKPGASNGTEQDSQGHLEPATEVASPKAASPTAASPKAASPKAASPKAESPKAATAASFEVPDAPVQDGGDSDSSEADTDEEMPHLEGGASSAKGEARQNRSEKKSRKAVLKLGMKPFAGISRVTMKKAPNVLFVIERPEVFKAASSETYVVFGEARIEDLSAQAQASAAERVTSTLADTSGEAQKVPRAAELEEDENEDVDENGMEAKDIELVMAQGGVSRGRAVKALKATDNDIVEAIMALSSV